MTPDLTFAMLSFVAFAIPIIGALWKIFSLRESLQAAIGANSHRLDLLEQRMETLLDQQELALNGLKELCNHVRLRSQRNEERLAERLGDTEAFLEKTTPFSRRRHDPL